MTSKLNWQFYFNTKLSHSLRGFTQRGLGFVADVDYQLSDCPTKVFVGISDSDSFGPFVGQVGHLWQVNSSEGWNGKDYYTFNCFGDLTGRQVDRTYLMESSAIALDDQTALHLITAARDLQQARPEMYSSLDACVSGIMKSPRKA